MNRFISINEAALRDAADPLAPLRAEFHFPTLDGEEVIYLTGNSLGLQPRGTEHALATELASWRQYGVEAHFHGPNPWMPYHERLTGSLARLAGAKPSEVVAMGSLTGNLHTLLASFYRPTAERPLLMSEAKAFPSDQYALASQVQWHAHGELFEIRGTDPEGAPTPDEVLKAIAEHGRRGATLLLGGVHYFTGRAYPIAEITAAAQAQGMLVGWDLAHAMGNIPARLHDWGVDFACWCSYKYLNSGPGAVAGAFVHERHGADTSLPRFAGWWGNDPGTRFAMGPDFVARAGADGWQCSNPPILALAPLLASLRLFDRAGMDALHAKSLRVTGYLRALLREWAPDGCRVITPDAPGTHGAQLSVAFDRDARARHAELGRRGIVCDFREPNIVRLAPAPLYNGFADARAAAAALCGK